MNLIQIENVSYIFSEPNKSAIYGILNLINGKIYIGSAMKYSMRKSSHISKLNKNVHVNIYLQHAWNKYGETAFEFVILEYCNKIELLEREQCWIDLTNSNNPNCGYNIRKEARSNLGLKYPATAGEKVRQANLGKIHTAEHRAKNAISKIGIKLSEETKAKIGKANSDKNKWPHGYKCNCRQCLDKKNLERRLLKYNHGENVL